MVDLEVLADHLRNVEAEANHYGLSRALRERLSGARAVLPVIEEARERKLGVLAA